MESETLRANSVVTASMRPEPRGSGNKEGKPDVRDVVESFNEAGAARLRKLGKLIYLGFKQNSFNEAGAARLRK